LKKAAIFLRISLLSKAFCGNPPVPPFEKGAKVDLKGLFKKKRVDY